MNEFLDLESFAAHHQSEFPTGVTLETATELDLQDIDKQWLQSNRSGKPNEYGVCEPLELKIASSRGAGKFLIWKGRNYIRSCPITEAPNSRYERPKILDKFEEMKKQYENQR